MELSAKKEGLVLPMIEIPRLHTVFGGDPKKAFVHFANIGENLGVLADLSFCQFIDQQGRIYQDENIITGYLNQFPSILTLLKDGMMPLTDQSLKEYLAATTIGDKSYIQNATVEALRGKRLI